VRYEARAMPPDKLRLLVADDLAEEGIAALRRTPGLTVDVRVGLPPAELIAIIGDYDALAVRSATQVTAKVLEAGGRLKLVGRAGVGVDNIDLAAATRRGVVVMNTPSASSLAVAELTLAMMFALARQIPEATASVKGGRWEKKKFAGGRELSGRTLGVVGTGNIGAVVVDRARGLGMRVLASDPFLSAEAALRIGVELVSLEDLLRQADFVTLHVPLTDANRNLIGAKELALMRPGAFLINCARGGLIDEDALNQALAQGRLGGAGLDVFAREPPAADHPLLRQPRLVCTPHLGASTDEAQVAVAVALAEQMVDCLVHQQIRNAVNAPSLSRELRDALGPFLNLAERLGALVGQLAPAHIDRLHVAMAGVVPAHPGRPVLLAALRGLLRQAVGEAVNDVNGPLLAEERGIRLAEERSEQAGDFTSLLTVTVSGPGGEVRAAGTLLGAREPRLVRLNQFELDAVPEGPMLMVRNRDVPKVIGHVGLTLGDAGLNIARMALSRAANGEALSLLNLDSPASAEVLDRLRALPAVEEVRRLQL